MLTKTQLLGFQADTYYAAIERWGQAADAVNAACNTILGVGGQISDWTGPAADQAAATANDLLVAVEASPNLLNDAQDTVAAFAATVNEQQQILQTAINRAQSLSCSVSEDGTVTPPAQPPGEPPSVCSPEYKTETALQNAQEAYYNSSAFQQWQAATEQAPGLQTTIQAALQAATAADSRAARDLEAGIRGAGDVGKILAGRDPTGSYATNLEADTQTLGDGQRWLQPYVKQAAGLLPEAANGDTAAAKQLELLTPLSYDQDFSAALMNRLGAAGLEKLPLEMGEKLQDLSAGDPELMSTVRPYDQAVLHFLGDSLASASNSPNLSAGFVQRLAANDALMDPDSPDDEPVGFWALGQILGGSTGAVQYNPQFLDTVGTAIINFDAKQEANPLFKGWEYTGPFMSPWANNMNLPSSFNFFRADEPSFGGNIDSGGDPIYGLMHAAALSPAAAQALFGCNVNPKTGAAPENPNLRIVLTQLPWTFDRGSALGAALQAATSGPGAVSDGITSDIVHTLALQYEQDSGYAAQMSGLDTHVANILSQQQNMLAINKTVGGDDIAAGPNSVYAYATGLVGPGFDRQDLARVLGVISQNPSAYGTLQTAQVKYLQTQLDEAVASAMATGGISTSPNASAIGQVLNEGTTTLGFLEGAKTLIAQDQATASTAALQQSLSTDSDFLSVGGTLASALPGGQVVGIPATIASTILSGISASEHASNAPSAAGAQQELALQDLCSMALAAALLKNQVPPPQFGNYDPSFLGKNGHLLPAQAFLHDSPALASLNSWLAGLKVPGTSNFNQTMTNQIKSGFELAGSALVATGG
jgi:hypothetical protein